MVKMRKDVVWDVNRAAPLLWRASLKLIFDFQRDGYALAFGQSATTGRAGGMRKAPKRGRY